MKDLKISTKIILGYAVVLLLMIAVSTTAYLSIKSLIKTSTWVEHTHEVIGTANKVGASMVDMETGKRGFLVTGIKGYLEPYHNGLKDFDKFISKGAELTSDNATQVKRWNEVKALKSKWISQSAEPEIKLRKEVVVGEKAIQHFKEISARTLGKELFDDIRIKLSILEKKSNNNVKVRSLITLTTLALVNMETGQRGFLLSGKEESLHPYINGEKSLIKYLNILSKAKAGTSISNRDIQAVKSAVTLWQTKVANVEIEARREMNKHKYTIDDITSSMAEGKGKLYMDAIRGKLSEIVKAEEVLMGTRLEAQHETADFATNFTLFGTIIAFIFGVIIATFISKNIANLIHNFQNGLLNFFRYLNKEIEDVELLDDNSKDEIGKMSKVVNENIKKTQIGIEEDRKFIDETIVVLSEFEQGDLCKRIKTSVSNPALMELKKVLDSMGNNMEKNIEEVLNILEQYTQYNYMNKVDTSHVKNQLLDLANGVNLLGDSITSMLVENKRVGLTLNQSSHTLLNNVNTLNDASSEAAASLEETAAALEEMTGTIISNTEHVSEMAQFANKVIASVEEGNDLANQTTKSMDEINEQVTAINDAIVVIDQIAFQTNILSLNAAVEAATAGEAGKGFAVVAQEVRNLAARSAEAAKEIKELVENANNKTGEGKNISDKMIFGYKALNENIQKTISLIKDVESASKEQKSGIEQINDAVTKQDQQTQQIASAANETYDIAIHTSKISEKTLENVEAKEFEGKEQVIERRTNQVDLSHAEESCKRESEKAIREHKKNRRTMGNDNKLKSKVEKKENPRVQNSRTQSEPVKQQTFKDKVDNDEWESF